MQLKELAVVDFRNIQNASLIFEKELTVISGDNGQGKTSLLESIFLLTGSKSFRGAKDLELVRHQADFAKVKGTTIEPDRENTIELLIEGGQSGRRGRFAQVNGVDYGRATAIAGKFTAVVFEPNHLSLIKSGPEGRRKFLDAALCQLYPNYISVLRRYNRALVQKNALLRKYYESQDADALLDAFDAELSGSGTEITQKRLQYLQYLSPISEAFYSDLSRGQEKMQIHFSPSSEKDELLEKLQQARKRDIHAGFSTVGPHREDFEVIIKEKSARTYGSQGQQRSGVLSLKLAESEVAYKITGEKPVLLLDDVLSELDEGRQSYLLSQMHGIQSFVSCCDASVFQKTSGQIVHVQEGKFTI